MPLFEYRCAQCQHLEEVLQKHGEPAPEACAACGAAGSMAKEISLTSFQLKGGGWYKDLYGSTPASGSSSTASSSGDGAATSGSSSGAARAGGGGEPKPSPQKSEAPSSSAKKASDKVA